MKPIYLLLSGWSLLNSAHPVFTAPSEKEATGLTPVYTIACPVGNVNFHSRSSFGFTTQGLVAITNDRATLVCYDFDGKVLWQRQPPEKVISAVSVSGDGSKIIAHYPLSEDAAIVEVMTAEGTVIWRNVFAAGFRLSHKGKYLYSNWDMLDGNPLIVIDADSGAILWQRRMQMYWEQVLDEETLVTVDQSGLLRLFEMKSGQILLERDIGAAFSDELSHVTWSLSVSADGNFLTVVGRSGLSNSVLIQTCVHPGK